MRADRERARASSADWGYAILLEQAVVTRGAADRPPDVRLRPPRPPDRRARRPARRNRDRRRLRGGRRERAEAEPRTARAARRAASPLAPPKGPKRDPDPKPPRDRRPSRRPSSRNPPANVRPQLTAAGYVFPVYGPSLFTDDFAAARAITGWHHGNDIFAPVGAPVLAVTDGTLFLVGWNDVGGNRVWLRDRQGNEFYYAHLSAFSPLAFEGSQVKAGDVIGFVGATGDAVGTPPHLHFEIHPAALLGLGYDGVVNPYSYLLAWRRVADATFDWGAPEAGRGAAAGRRRPPGGGHLVRERARPRAR